LEKAVTNSFHFKHFSLTVKTGKATETNTATAVVEQPTPVPVAKPPFQYWGVVGLIVVAIVYLNAYIYWKRKNKGV
jgi:hypothetical protein